MCHPVTYSDGMRVVDVAGEGRALDVLLVIADGDGPLAGLVRLEGGGINAVLLLDGAHEWPVCGGVCRDVDVTAASTITVDLRATKELCVRKGAKLITMRSIRVLNNTHTRYDVANHQEYNPIRISVEHSPPLRRWSLERTGQCLKTLSWRRLAGPAPSPGSPPPPPPRSAPSAEAGTSV